MALETFIVTVPVTVRRGWGVWFIPIYEGWVEDDDGNEYYSNRVVDVDAGIVEISPETVSGVDGYAIVEIEPDIYMLLSNFHTPEELGEQYDDTIDLRSVIYPTREEAEERLDYILDLFHNPNPWTVFIRTN